MGLIITRGLGTDVFYKPVPVCEPEMTVYEWGKKSMKVEPCIVAISECEEQD